VFLGNPSLLEDFKLENLKPRVSISKYLQQEMHLAGFPWLSLHDITNQLTTNPLFVWDSLATVESGP
jgi:hypothetical protein